MNPGQPQPMDPIQCPNACRFKCPDCQEDVDVMVRRPVLYNAPTAAVLVFTHETPDTCPKCGTKFLFKIVGINQQFQLQIVWVKLPSKESALVPGTEENMKTALGRMGTIADITGRKQ